MILVIPIVLSVLIGFLLLWGSKTAIGIIVCIFFALLSIPLMSKVGFEKVNKYILCFIVATIPFPYLIQFAGKDAVTITTILICFVFTFLVLDRLWKKSPFLKSNFEFVLPALLLVSITASLLLNPTLIGQSFRHYIANCSGVLLYFIVLATIKNKSDVILVIKIILFLLILQSVIAFLQLRFPSIGTYLIPFGRRTGTMNVAFEEGYTRASGTIWDYELLAEWFLVGVILSISLIYETRKYIFPIAMFFCMAGIAFTKTRSCLFIIAIAFILIFILLNLLKKDYKGTSIKLMVSIILGCGIFAITFPFQTQALLQRIGMYAYSSSLISPGSFNRQYVWQTALYLLRSPKLFGNGLYDANYLYTYVLPGGFHSLYFTTLYKMGIFGMVIYVIFWLKMLKKAWHIILRRRESNNWYILFFLTIAVILTLINEAKIEFLRHSHTIQFTWVIYDPVEKPLKLKTGRHSRFGF